MEKITLEAKFYQYAVEGDIEGAYNNIQQDTLLKILSKRFTDKKFLNLIKKGLECGYMLEFQTYQTLLGTPQGSICSPILFNIYMQEFDKYILNEMLQQINPNTTTNQRSNEVNPEYEKAGSRKKKKRLKLNEFKYKYNRDLKKLNLSRFVAYYKQSNYVNQVLFKNKEIEENAKNTEKTKLYITWKAKEIGEAFRNSILSNTTEEQQEILKQEYENFL
jgi:retron-type reverse transcriptase